MRKLLALASAVLLAGCVVGRTIDGLRLCPSMPVT
jgi:hypothetical protein